VTISVVMPVLDEAARIDASIDAVRAQPGIGELIVVDGGSADGTAERAAAHPGVEVIAAPRGRGSQLNAGAARARGEVLWFVHADVTLPPRASEHVTRALARPQVVGGAFRTRHVAERAGGLTALALRLADLRSRYSRVPYGDQAMFVRAAVFRELGGYPVQPLMEDLELSRRLRRRGAVVIASAEVRVSGRRFEAAPLRAAACWNAFPPLYALGVSPRTLVRWYGDPR
jgi:rSAM/selenodomain-associated transferase 2